MTDAGESCDIAASCLCGSASLPADGVLEATITSSYVAQVTQTFGTTPFAVGDVICVDQSTVGATILVPVRNTGDAAQVVPPPPDGGTCVPNFAYTVALDDAGRPLACNDGTESSLTLTESQAVTAMRAADCTTSLATIDSRWSTTNCPPPSGCNSTASSPHLLTPLALLLTLFTLHRRRRHIP